MAGTILPAIRFILSLSTVSMSYIDARRFYNPKQVHILYTLILMYCLIIIYSIPGACFIDILKLKYCEFDSYDLIYQRFIKPFVNMILKLQ